MLRSRKIRGLILGGVPEWPKGADCKSAGSTFGGSNPPPSTKLKGQGARDEGQGVGFLFRAGESLDLAGTALITGLRRLATCHSDLATGTCGCSSMVELQPSKLNMWVRFPSPAPKNRGEGKGASEKVLDVSHGYGDDA